MGQISEDGEDSKTGSLTHTFQGFIMIRRNWRMELGFGSLGQKNGASQEILKDYRTCTCNACNAALHYMHFRQKITVKI
jgi:hypothetical protein